MAFPGPITNRRRWDKLNDHERETYRRVRMAAAQSQSARNTYSPSRAAREQGTTLRSWLKYAPDSLERRPDGRWRVKTAANDRLFRRIDIVSSGRGQITVDVHNSREAAIARDYGYDVRRYLSASRTKDRAAAAKRIQSDPRYRNRRGFAVEIDGEALVLDMDEIDELAQRGQIDLGTLGRT